MNRPKYLIAGKAKQWRIEEWLDDTMTIRFNSSSYTLVQEVHSELIRANFLGYIARDDEALVANVMPMVAERLERAQRA